MEVYRLLDQFTPRQISILIYLVYGWKYTEIAKALDCSNNTVRNHIYQIIKRTNYRTIYQLLFHLGQNTVTLELYNNLIHYKKNTTEDCIRLLIASGGSQCINAQLNKKKS